MLQTTKMKFVFPVLFIPSFNALFSSVSCWDLIYHSTQRTTARVDKSHLYTPSKLLFTSTVPRAVLKYAPLGTILTS